MIDTGLSKESAPAIFEFCGTMYWSINLHSFKKSVGNMKTADIRKFFAVVQQQGCFRDCADFSEK